MDENFTLLLLLQHYPVSQQLQVLSCEDVSVDANVAGFLHAAERQVSQFMLDRIYAYASTAVRR